MIVSLIEDHEFRALRIEALPEEVRNRGMDRRHLPIPDRMPPAEAFRAAWPLGARDLVTRLSRGERVFLHCMGGLGRTGTIACLLIESGLSVEAAIAAVRAARRGTIETAA